MKHWLRSKFIQATTMILLGGWVLVGVFYFTPGPGLMPMCIAMAFLTFVGGIAIGYEAAGLKPKLV